MFFKVFKVGVLLRNVPTGNGPCGVGGSFPGAAGSRGASVGQAVKVKAETGPDLETQPLLDPVQLDRTTPKTGSKNPRAEEEGRREK